MKTSELAGIIHRLSNSLASEPIGVISLRQIEALTNHELSEVSRRSAIRGCGDYVKCYSGNNSYAQGVPVFIVRDHDKFLTQLTREISPENADAVMAEFTLRLIGDT